MIALLEALAVLVVVGVVVAAAVVVIRERRSPSSAPPALPEKTVSDRHHHRWTRWQVLDERRIHLYGEVDEGRDLPDRVDVVLRRECARCGMPQTQTVRGLDPRDGR